MTPLAPSVLALLAATLLAACTTTPKAPPADLPASGERERIACTHRDAAIEAEIGYCEAVRVGRTVHISGVVGVGPMESAIPKVYEALRQVLAGQGLTFDDVVKETVYTTDMDAFVAHKDMRKPFYGGHLPAATWVQVQRLYDARLVLEVELVAEHPLPGQPGASATP
jgi:enamine deaminase RidA (YjgF/YER057c/UK114 family)